MPGAARRCRTAAGPRRGDGERGDRALTGGRAPRRARHGHRRICGANALGTGIEIELRQWDLYLGLPDGPWDLVVSNPPYVLPEEIDALEPEVRDWEPREALVGVGATEAVARGALDVLAPDRALVLEVAAGNAARVAGMLGELGYADVTTTKDLTGRDRVVEGVRGT